MTYAEIAVSANYDSQLFVDFTESANFLQLTYTKNVINILFHDM